MPADPDCAECNGTGWREVSKEGVTGVERCQCVSSPAREDLAARARIPPRFSNASFDNFFLPDGNPVASRLLVRAMIVARAFAREYPLAPKPGLLLHGSPGAGKTHLAVAVARGLLARGIECVFFDYQALLDRIREGFDPAAGASSRESYQAALETEVLLLDDLGSHRATEWVEDTVTGIINHRYNAKKSVIATTNLPDSAFGDAPSEKNPALGQFTLKDTLSERIGPRARSRLFEMCRVVPMGTYDYRLKKLSHGASA